MIEGAAKWVMGEDGYPTLDFNDRVQNWGDAAEAVTPVDGVYYIDKPEQLAYIAKIVNEGNTLEGKTVLLRNDLDLSGKSWTPIGRYQIPFSGELNGNGRSVTGLAISYNSLGYLEGYAGLVGFAGKTAYLHFLNINGSILSSRDSCGLLLGGSWSGSQIERCTVSGSVTARSNIGGIASVGFRISQCEAKDVILTTSPGNGSAGGICGYLDYYYFDETTGEQITPYISECVSSGSVTGYSIGGILNSVSSFGASIQNCTSSMVLTGTSSIGGIAACTVDSASIMNCYFTGSIISDESKKSGLVAGQGSYGSTPTISNCYWSKECNMTIDGLPNVKRGVGTDVSEDPTTGLTLTEMRTKASYAGWDFDTIWAIDTNKKRRASLSAMAGRCSHGHRADEPDAVCGDGDARRRTEHDADGSLFPDRRGRKAHVEQRCAGRRVSHSWRTGRSPQGGHCDHHSLLWQLASKLLRDCHGAKQRRIHDP